MSFQSNLKQYSQEHFEIIEIDLPVITGACTLTDDEGITKQGFGTPLSCDEAWTGEYMTYRFCTVNSPALNNIRAYRCIKSISETTPKLKSGKGLASRGSLSITLDDFIGDPNLFAPGVATGNVKNVGTFFGKLNARQIMANKEVRLKCYRKVDGILGTNHEYTDSDAEIRYYLIESFRSNGNGTWSLQCKDELSATNAEEKAWPVASGSRLRLDINNSQTNIPVGNEVDYTQLLAAAPFNVLYIRISDEFMKVTNATGTVALNNQVLTVQTRNGSIFASGSGKLLTKTDVDEHSAGDDIFICEVSDDETIDSVLTRMLTDSGVPASYIPSADWANEVNTWLPDIKINTLWYESEDLSDQMNKLLQYYMLDMWFDPVLRQIRLTAVSVWKQSTITIREGKEIRYGTLRVSPQESLRASRALVVYDKRYLADNDEVSSYARAARYTEPFLANTVYYGEHKDIVFDPSPILDNQGAELLVRRTVSRFGLQPNEYSWITDENKRTFNTGDVVSIISDGIQWFDGSIDQVVRRAQITSVTPSYSDGKREYRVTALTYEITAQSGDVFYISEAPLSNSLNLHAYADLPAGPVELTFVIDMDKMGSDSVNHPTVIAGAFAEGSKITVILINGTLLSAKGGKGGHGGYLFVAPGQPAIHEYGDGGDGARGGTVFDVQGVDVDIYLSGPTPIGAYPVADGYLFAPAGGDGGNTSSWEYEPGGSTNYRSGDGGRGGAGYRGGDGGEPGIPDGMAIPGNTGQTGIEDKTQKAKFGIHGSPGFSVAPVLAVPGNGGPPGFGIIDSVGGATVNFFVDPGEQVTDRYIQGDIYVQNP